MTAFTLFCSDTLRAVLARWLKDLFPIKCLILYWMYNNYMWCGGRNLNTCQEKHTVLEIQTRYLIQYYFYVSSSSPVGHKATTKLIHRALLARPLLSSTMLSLVVLASFFRMAFNITSNVMKTEDQNIHTWQLAAMSHDSSLTNTGSHKALHHHFIYLGIYVACLREC